MNLALLLSWLFIATAGRFDVHVMTPQEIAANQTLPGMAALAGCDPGQRPSLWLGTAQPDTALLVHEMAHIYDCLDDGMLNGSPGHHDRPQTFREAMDRGYSWDCWSGHAPWTGDLTATTEIADAEYYACSVAQTGSIR